MAKTSGHGPAMDGIRIPNSVAVLDMSLRSRELAAKNKKPYPDFVHDSYIARFYDAKTVAELLAAYRARDEALFHAARLVKVGPKSTKRKRAPRVAFASSGGSGDDGDESDSREAKYPRIDTSTTDVALLLAHGRQRHLLWANVPLPPTVVPTPLPPPEAPLSKTEALLVDRVAAVDAELANLCNAMGDCRAALEAVVAEAPVASLGTTSALEQAEQTELECWEAVCRAHTTLRRAYRAGEQPTGAAELKKAAEAHAQAVAARAAALEAHTAMVAECLRDTLARGTPLVDKLRDLAAAVVKSQEEKAGLLRALDSFRGHV